MVATFNDRSERRRVLTEHEPDTSGVAQGANGSIPNGQSPAQRRVRSLSPRLRDSEGKDKVASVLDTILDKAQKAAVDKEILALRQQVTYKGVGQ
jgi:anti-sigma factor ChrR (cupin superfamily)